MVLRRMCLEIDCMKLIRLIDDSIMAFGKPPTPDFGRESLMRR